MKNLIKSAMLMLVVSAMLLSLCSCELLENLGISIPGIGDNNQEPPHEHLFVEGKCECGESDPDYVPPHVHAYEAAVTAPTCTEGGFTTYTCECGDSYVGDETAATGHSYDTSVTEPTCTVPGATVYTCACGDSYSEEIPVVEHVDTNLDITCDYEGCTKRILPAADSHISLFTANKMIIMSLSNSYYMEGVITEIKDFTNGVFVVEDAAGDKVLVRLPKDAEGNSYSAWKTLKVVVGDTVQLYGKPTQNTDTTTKTEFPAKVEGAVLTVLKHEHQFSEPTCENPGKCACLGIGADALGHLDENKDKICDRCQWNLKLLVTEIAIGTDPSIGGVVDDAKTFWTWGNDQFEVVIAKGTSTVTLYTTAKAYMQLKKLNTLTVTPKNGELIQSITIFVTNATQFSNIKTAIGTAYEYTEDEATLSVTITLNGAESFTLTNNGTQTAYVSGVKIAYEKPQADPVTVVMANTVTDAQTTVMTGGNDAALVGLDADMFTVTSDKGSYGAHAFLYYKSSLAVPSQIRLYNHTSGNGNSITVAVKEGYQILSVKITFSVVARAKGYQVTDASGAELYSVALDASPELDYVEFDVNSQSFTFKNLRTGSSDQIWIASIEITYQEA